MLIKYYDYTLSPVSDLFIIENIERKRLFKGWCLLEFKNVGDFFKNGVPEMILNEGNVIPQNFPGVAPLTNFSTNL